MEHNVRIEVFKKHWSHAIKIMNKETLTYDEAEPVVYYIEQMVSLIVNDSNNSKNLISSNEGLSLSKINEAIKEAETLECVERDSIFLYCLEEDIFNKIHNWCGRCMGDMLERLKRQQLRMFSAVVEQGQSALLQSNEILHPLLRLLREYSLRSSRQLELSLVKLLHVLSVRVSNDPNLYSLCCYGPQNSNDPVNSVEHLLYPLVPFLHREQPLGGQARDAVLLQLVATGSEQLYATVIALQSDFCPILATGLSALYSALPRRIETLTRCTTLQLGKLLPRDIDKIPTLKHFLDYLQFCCQVCKITHPLIREAVLHYIYNGFLLPVLGASLNQNSMEEVTSATIYLELFLRSVNEPGILKAFLCFIVAESHDEYRILNSLINRISSNTGLAIASLSLLNTLLQFQCEDVMFELVFKYLISMKHLNQSQRTSITSNKFLQDSVCHFMNLRIKELSSKRVFIPEYLDYAHNQINEYHFNIDGNWRFDYNGINPSADYLAHKSSLQPDLSNLNGIDKKHRPFHGFLDHYSQLLEMRDVYKRTVSCNMSNNMDGGSGSGEYDENMSMSSGLTTPTVPFSPAPSQRSTADTIVSMMKFEDNDAQLDRCLHKLRFPSQEDLLEQRTRYMLSYTSIGPDYCSSEDSMSVDSQSMRLSDRHHKGFDIIRPVTPEDDEEDEELDELYNSNINLNNIDKLANCEQVEDFLLELDNVNMDEKKVRCCQFSLDKVLQTLNELNQTKEKEEAGVQNGVNHDGRVKERNSPVMSIRSAFTMEDDDDMMMLRYKAEESGDENYETRRYVTESDNVNMGTFLYSVLDRLENLLNNPIQINLALSTTISALLSYSQPLLVNFLLDINMSNNSEIKCLFGVLEIVRTKLEDAKFKLNQSKNDDGYFCGILHECQSLLEKRYQIMMDLDQSLDLEEFKKICEDLHIPIMNYNAPSKLASSRKSISKRQFNFLQLFKDRSNSSNHINISETTSTSTITDKNTDDSRIYQLGYSTIIFDELCHEISAFSQEHSVFLQPSSLNYIHDY